MANPTNPARALPQSATHATKTAAGTFLAWLTGSEIWIDDDSGETGTMLTYLMQTPSGETMGFFANDAADGRGRFFAIVW